MPLTKITFKPGVNRETTSYGDENGWFNSDLIRFRKGRPEKMGGWTRLSSQTIEGTGRSLHAWSALDSSSLMGLGTEVKFYVESGGGYNDITPVRATTTLGADPIRTGASGSGVLTITAPSHGAVEGDFVIFSGSAAVDNISATQINTEHEITVIDANSYTVTTTESASSGNTAGGGSAVIAEYQINTGLGTVISGPGWGAGLWGGSTTVYSQTTLATTIDASITSSIVLTSGTDFEVSSTTTSADLTATSYSIPLADASAFPDKGTVKIGSEYIRYATKTVNTLSGLTRGSDATTAAASSSGAAAVFVGIIQLEDELIMYTGKSTHTLNVGIVRGVRGTTGAAHDSGVTVKEANDFVGWGLGASTSASTGSNIRLWSQDNYGEDLVLCAFDGGVYYWDNTLGLSARASALSAQSGASDAPTISRKVLLSGADRHVICFGCNPRGSSGQDLLQVRWSDQEDPFNWTPEVDNTAGGIRISSGSQIISAQRTRQEILIWTDMNMHAMRYVGGDLVFSFSLVAGNTSLLGPNTSVTVGDKVFWMDRENFYAYAGSVQVVPCTVLRYVFDNINLEQSFKFFAASNRMFDEVFWFYATAASNEINAYAKFNYTEGTWDIGSLVRTAWTDYGIHANPRGCGVSSNGENFVYIHESGQDNDGVAMNSFIESADFDQGDGDTFMFMSRMIPDIDITDSSADSSGSVDYILKTRNFPGDSLTINSTNAVTPTTQQVFLRSRSRQAALRIESSVTNLAWTLGDLRLDLRPDGRR
jgi:hypothetical protein